MLLVENWQVFRSAAGPPTPGNLHVQVRFDPGTSVSVAGRRSTGQQYHQQIAQVCRGAVSQTSVRASRNSWHTTTPQAGLQCPGHALAGNGGGQRAMERSGYREAVVCFEQALVALRRFPESRDMIEQAIDLCFRHPLCAGCFWRAGTACSSICARRRPSPRFLDDRQRLAQVAVFMTEYFRMVSDLDQAVESGQRARRFPHPRGCRPAGRSEFRRGHRLL